MNNLVKEAQEILFFSEMSPLTVGEAERAASYYGCNGGGMTVYRRRGGKLHMSS